MHRTGGNTCFFHTIILSNLLRFSCCHNFQITRSKKINEMETMKRNPLKCSQIQLLIHLDLRDELVVVAD